MIKAVLVCGARPNFMKIAPLMKAITRYNTEHETANIEPFLVHTGQHYDLEMSKVFFQELELPEPDLFLGIGSGTHAEQTARILIELEKALSLEKPDLVIVVGDVNSTLAAALAAAKLHIPVVHVEAGLRSHDKSMPEEINRVLTDAISDYLFTTSVDNNDNLKHEGVAEEKIYLVGNVMVDCITQYKEKADKSLILNNLGLAGKGYALVTLHRPSNVDNQESLYRIIEALSVISQRIPVIFPVHPRANKNIKKFGFDHYFVNNKILAIEPLGYIDFLNLEMNSKLVLTDSGGMQEETTVLNVPCLTLRDTTERPVTVTQGTNTLVWNVTERIIEEAHKVIEGHAKNGRCPEFWDGKAAERIVDILTKDFAGNVKCCG
ncbi:MAG: UDP-N-acetylglucosamine 2-epimerase (non-hydrolyzing) [Dehalococcoidales bacterium]|nr:UDP-N-acetylglucosamine 2-epimerase (non-hydrolyzing) [Dehalococcoidales bacterium]